MNLLFAILFLCGMSITTAQAQGDKPKFSPEDTISFIKIKLTNPDNTPYANSPVVLKGKKGHVVKVKTDNTGNVKAKVPFNETYTVHCGENTCMKSIDISDFPYVTYEYQAYTKRFIHFTFTYKSPQGNALKGEEVIVHSVATGTQYKDSTDAKGQVKMFLPFESQFKVSVKYHDVVTMLNPQDVGKEYKMMTATFTWMGAKEKERREHVMDSLARVRNMEITYLLDSLVKAGKIETIVKEDIYIPIDYDSVEWVETMLQQKAEGYKKMLASNPLYLEEQKKAVLAPLHRLRKKFGSKIIVTDITGSMYPYMEQVLLWHALNFMGEEGTKYLFFNDGDSHPDGPIGSSGGFYFCQGKIKDFKTIINTMRKGTRAGGGGAGPENDIEALLEATKKKSQADEVILVADNFSTVRDISLMKKLKVPVRVILCGIEESFVSPCTGTTYSNSINEEYIDLARFTGGSIHTVTEDIYDLAKIKEGESITIQGKKYDFVGGRFLLQTGI